MIGRTLSHYRVLEKLGAGGMGEVYRARDEKLGRDVAVKVLPPGLLASEAAKARFRKEAEALSRLSHPHIATLFDFDSEGGVDFLVMERVEGKTLQEAVREGPLSEKEVVRLGSQLARGLQAAHEHGVVHRDLKPGNLALTGDGLLKVLDFGLARLERLALPEAGEVTASTDTAVGQVVGTPSYMAPEQLRGRGVDARTDVYGAGACLYELATGRRPFGTKSGVELTDAVLHEAPVSPRSVVGGVSPGLEAVILKCLDKDPELRYQTAKELLVDLERLQAAVRSSAAGPPLAAASHRRRWLAVVAVTAVALAAVAWFLRSRQPPRVTGVRALTRQLAFGTGLAGETAATDGERVYYLAKGADRTTLLQQPVAGGDPVEVPLPFAFERGILGYVPSESALLMAGATEVVNADAPDFGVPLWLVPVPAGTPRRIPNLTARWADLSPDARTLVLVRGQSAGNHRLYLARVDGSGERPLIEVPAGVGVVRWAPDGRRLRFTSAGPPGHEREQWIWETSMAGEAPRPLWRGHSGAWTRDGRYFIYCGPAGGLVVLPESPRPWEQKPVPRPLTVGPLSYTFAQSDPRGRWLLAMGSLFGGELLRYRAETKQWEPALGGESVIGVEASPDRRWLAWVRLPDASLWRSRPDGSERLRLTGPGVEAHRPSWSADGRSVVFAGRTTDDLQYVIRVVAVDGSSAEVVASPEDPRADYWDPCWLPDGSIVFSHLDTGRPGAIGLLRFDPAADRTERLAGAEQLRYPRCSGQGHLLAAGRSEPGGFHFWMRRASAANWVEVGTFPLSYFNWRRDGRSFCGLNWLDRSAYSVDCVSVDSGRVTEAHPLGAPVPMLWRSARWTGLDEDDRPLVVADRSTTALYALDWEAP